MLLCNSIPLCFLFRDLLMDIGVIQLVKVCILTDLVDTIVITTAVVKLLHIKRHQYCKGLCKHGSHCFHLSYSNHQVNLSITFRIFQKIPPVGYIVPNRREVCENVRRTQLLNTANRNLKLSPIKLFAKLLPRSSKCAICNRTINTHSN